MSSLVLYVSLKSMWNLMNVIQIIAYFRLFTNWPANTLMIKEAINNAITLKIFSDDNFRYLGFLNSHQWQLSISHKVAQLTNFILNCEHGHKFNMRAQES